MAECSLSTSFATTSPLDRFTRWPEVNPKGGPDSCHSATGCCGSRRTEVAATVEENGARAAGDGVRATLPAAWVQPATHPRVRIAADAARCISKGCQPTGLSATHVPLACSRHRYDPALDTARRRGEALSMGGGTCMIAVVAVALATGCSTPNSSDRAEHPLRTAAPSTSSMPSLAR